MQRLHHLSLFKACPHLFPKHDTLYPETDDFVTENGNSNPFPDTKYPVSETSVDRPLHHNTKK